MQIMEMSLLQNLCCIMCLLSGVYSNIDYIHYNRVCSFSSPAKKGNALKCAQQCTIQSKCIGFEVVGSTCALKDSLLTCSATNPVYIDTRYVNATASRPTTTEVQTMQSPTTTSQPVTACADVSDYILLHFKVHLVSSK